MSDEVVEIPNEEDKPATLEIKDIGEAIEYVEKAAVDAASRSQKFVTNFKELTGYEPNKAMNALDVYKIALRVVRQELSK